MLSSPISPERPRQAAPPLVAMSSTSRAVMPVGPRRCLPRSSAARDSIHRDALSVEAEPSQPSPTGTPAARNSRTGANPPPPMSMFDEGQCATPTPALPSRETSAGFG